MNVWWEGFLLGFGFFLVMIALIYVWLLLLTRLIGKEYIDNYLINLEKYTQKRPSRASIVPIPEAEEITPSTNTINHEYIVTIVPDATVINE
jgi:hypothetical protein